MSIWSLLRRLLWQISFETSISRNGRTTYAFTLYGLCVKNIPYIVVTTVPSQQTLLKPRLLQEWADNTTWLGLEILKRKALQKLKVR